MNTVLAPEAPLRGREGELALIREVLEHGSRGGTAVLTVEGMPGIGKTRLLSEAAALARQLGYQPARRPHGREARHHRLSAARTGARPAGPHLVILDDPCGTPDRPAHRARVPAPRGRSGPGRGVLLIAHRPGEAAALPGSLLADPAVRTERLVLGPLAPADTHRLAHDLLGAPPARSLAPLVDDTGGHPRLLIELLTGLREEGGVELTGGEAELLTERLPARLAARVRATLERYSPSCRQLLRVAAVLGDEVVYGELALMLRTSVSALLPTLEEVRATGVVRDTGTRAAFHSALLRRLVAESVPVPVRLALEQEAATLRSARRGQRQSPQAPAARHGEPSGQQRALVALVAEGLTNQQIASRLALSPHTVNYHLRKLFKHYGVSSRIDLLRAAARAH
ncbi:LuxR C-terminal-related transcriptional regulator [Streptomyces sp. SKN60]|uniref:LuxR family transcriptional regulator n=1 Tax=Streptomyces sp. SKN60 TaxID=2855506 RepID=UPI0022481BEB|nr:LuxR family transcriptional regulator [Streptomyces sp. SKN60]MCX2181908.1 LuxR C-terminal-related transcriptional regulator [Streptomyces sp. SKN60]